MVKLKQYKVPHMSFTGRSIVLPTYKITDAAIVIFVNVDRPSKGKSTLGIAITYSTRLKNTIVELFV